MADKKGFEVELSVNDELLEDLVASKKTCAIFSRALDLASGEVRKGPGQTDQSVREGWIALATKQVEKESGT